MACLRHVHAFFARALLVLPASRRWTFHRLRVCATMLPGRFTAQLHTALPSPGMALRRYTDCTYHGLPTATLYHNTIVPHLTYNRSYRRVDLRHRFKPALYVVRTSYDAHAHGTTTYTRCPYLPQLPPATGTCEQVMTQPYHCNAAIRPHCYYNHRILRMI